MSYRWELGVGSPTSGALGGLGLHLPRRRSLEKSSRQAESVPIDAGALQLAAAAKDEPSRQVEHAELRDALTKAIADLPPAYRIAIALRDVEGLSTRQAAEIAGVSQAAFKSRLHQARHRLRVAIGDQALTGSGW